MAIAYKDPWISGNYLNDPENIEIQEIAIGGKLVRVYNQLSTANAHAFESDQAFREELKRRLVQQLVEYIIENQLAECTVMHRPDTQMTQVMARMYLAPNDQVKLLRVHGAIK
jgi:hypothetical protein